MILLDSTSFGSGVVASGSSPSIPHTIGTTTIGSPILWVGVRSNNANTTIFAQFNGVSMTQLEYSHVGVPIGEYLFYMVNPPIGTHNITFTNSGGTAFINVNAASYVNVETINPVDVHNSTNTSGTSFTDSVTTTVDKCWVIMNVSSDITATLAASTGFTARSGSGTSAILGDSNGPVTPAGSKALSVISSSSVSLTGAIASFKPSSSGPRYWVGGTGNWNDSSHWAFSSGGTGGETVPSNTNGNNVFFDGNSGSGTVTVNVNSTCIGLDFTGYTGTFAGSSTLGIGASLTIVPTVTFTYSGLITFTSTSHGNTLTSSGKLLPAITFNGAGGEWTIQDDLTVSSVTITNGSVVLGSHTIDLTGTGSVWSATGGTLSSGTSIIKLTNASSSPKTFSGGGKLYYNFWITGSGSGTYTIIGSNQFNDFKVDTPPHTVNFTAGSTQTLNTFTVSGTAGNLMTLQSTSSGNHWSLFKNTPGKVICDYLSLKDSHVS